MSFTFATCERRRALDFLKIHYKSRVVEDVAGNAKEILLGLRILPLAIK